MECRLLNFLMANLYKFLAYVRLWVEMKKLMFALCVFLLLIPIVSASHAYEGRIYEREEVIDEAHSENYVGYDDYRKTVRKYERIETFYPVYGYNFHRTSDGRRKYRVYEYDDLNGNYYTTHYKYGDDVYVRRTYRYEYDYRDDSTYYNDYGNDYGYGRRYY